MFPGWNVHVLGHVLSAWNAMFLVAVLTGHVVFARLVRRENAPLGFVHLRFAVVVYLSAIAAQLFAYAFDANTSLALPLGEDPVRYYLNPLAGPKTLYGVIVLMPVSVFLATLGSRIGFARALDLWTRPMLAVLAMARVGCLLEGCCFGARSDLFGVAFPAGSPVYWQQMAAGQLAESAAWSLPVVPTQALEAIVLGGLAVWCHTLSSRGGATGGAMFLFAAAAYSVFRFLAEFVRADAERGIYAGLATSQWIAVAVLAVVILVIASRRRGARTREGNGAADVTARVRLGDEQAA